MPRHSLQGGGGGGGSRLNRGSRPAPAAASRCRLCGGHAPARTHLSHGVPHALLRCRPAPTFWPPPARRWKRKMLAELPLLRSAAKPPCFVFPYHTQAGTSRPAPTATLSWRADSTKRWAKRKPFDSRVRLHRQGPTVGLHTARSGGLEFGLPVLLCHSLAAPHGQAQARPWPWPWVRGTRRRKT